MDENKSKLLHRALYAIKELEAKLKKGYQNEDIAIVGMSCRFPNGCNNPEEFWKHIEAGLDDIKDVPKERWDSKLYYSELQDEPGKTYTTKGGFLNFDVGEMDAKFFGMSPREAKEADPQQRLLLEVSWEALERAALTDENLKGSKTGVFIGVGSTEYAAIPRDKNQTGPYTATGIANNMAAGRIAHTFGLQGPALCVDTACSSALVALHTACLSLCSKECDCAIVGGSNLLLLPDTFVMLSKIKALSPKGKCKPFDEGADGYVRAEGCGVVVLKRLSDAERDQNPILAVIKGSAINHDGYTSGLTVPNGIAQKTLMEDALVKSGVRANDISYVETHGTGTALGDPIEVKAISDVYGRREQNNPLYLGAVKANVGHLEAAAGIAGLIKLVLCLQHKTIPPVLNFEKLNSRIELPSEVLIPTKRKNWVSDKQRVGAISSFGFSGTNVHVIVSEYNGMPKGNNAANKLPCILKVSAKDKESFLELCKRYLSALETMNEKEIGNFCYTANRCRNDYEIRKVFLGTSASELQKRIREWIENSNLDKKTPCRKMFLYLDECNSNKLDWYKIVGFSPLFTKLYNDYANKVKRLAGISEKDMENKGNIQLFCLQIALVELLIKYMIIPVGIDGKGVGEVVAGYVSGNMTLEDAISVLSKEKIDSNTGNSKFKNRIRKICIENDLFQCDALIYVGNKVTALSDIPNKVTLLTCELEYVVKDLPNIIGGMYELGVDITWDKLYYETTYCPSIIPTYPYHKSRYWIDSAINKETVQERPALEYKELLSPINCLQLEYEINKRNLEELADNQYVFHIGYYLELIQHLSERIYGHKFFRLQKMELYQAIYFQEYDKRIQIIAQPKNELNETYFKIYSIDEGQKVWNLNVEGCLVEDISFIYPKMSKQSREEKILKASLDYGAEVFDKMLYDQNFIIGESVRWVEHVWLTDSGLLAKFRLPKESENFGSYGLNLHPGIFDACAQLFMALSKKHLGDDKMFMVKRIEDFVFNNCRQSNSLWCKFSIKDNLNDKGYIEGSYSIFDENGKFVAQANGKQVKIIPTERRVALAKAIKNEVEVSSENLDEEFLLKLRNGSYNQKKEMLDAYLRKKVSKLLMMDEEDLDIEEPLGNLGMDSLIGFELKKIILESLDITVPMEVIIQGRPICELSKSVLQLLANEVVEQEELWYKQEYSLDVDKWIVYCKRRKAPKIRIFCIPYGAAGASIYREWNDLFSENIEVCPIQFPGKEGRIEERLICNIDEAVDSLCKVLETQLDVPFVIYGHSVGALIAYRLAYELCQRGKYPKELLVGAYSSPTIIPNPAYEKVREVFKILGFDDIPSLEELYELPEDKREFFDEFFAHELDGINMNDEIRRAVEPVAFSEFSIVGSFQFTKENGVIDVPVTVFHGKKDPVVSDDEILQWENVTSNSFHKYFFEGDHFFIQKEQQQKEFIQAVNERIHSHIEGV